MHNVVYTMHTTWNCSDAGRGKAADMQFLPLPDYFRGTLCLLHRKTIHRAQRQVLVSFYAYINNIQYADCTKKLHQQIKIHFSYFSWI